MKRGVNKMYELPLNKIKPPSIMGRIKGFDNLFDFLSESGYEYIDNQYDWKNFYQELRSLSYHMTSFGLTEVGEDNNRRKYSEHYLNDTLNQMEELNKNYSWIHISKELNERVNENGD